MVTGAAYDNIGLSIPVGFMRQDLYVEGESSVDESAYLAVLPNNAKHLLYSILNTYNDYQYLNSINSSSYMILLCTSEVSTVRSLDVVMFLK